MSDKTPILELTGSSYEIGYEHGNGVKEQVHFTLETYERMFHVHSNLSWKDACNKALLHCDAIEHYNAEYLYEMEGLAKGAGVSFEDVLAINTRSEIALTNVPDGCTAFALRDQNSRIWLAQNWDWTSTQSEALVHLHVKKKNIPEINMVTEAGIIGKIGSNSEGIGVGLNALVTNTVDPKKVPIHLGLRAVLESSSIDEALSKVGQNQMASPAHFLIASKSGGMFGLEVSPVHTARIKTSDNFTTHTNHILSNYLKQEIKEDPKSDSFTRYDVVNKLLEELDRNKINDSLLFEILSDHTNFPHSICRHTSSADEQNGERISETIFSIVINLSEDKLNWMKGHPCKQA